MSRSLGTSIESSFIAGFKTENSGLNFPENACTDVDNCVFSELGEVNRRGAVDVENDYVWKDAPISSTDVIKEFLWTGAGQSNDVNLVVNQIGNKLYIFEDIQGEPLSDSSTFITFLLDSYKVSGSTTTANDAISCTFGNGRLYVAHRYMQPFYLEFDSNTKTVSYTQLDITIRDFKVFNDQFDNDYEPKLSETNKEHWYNLYNQGWTTEEIAKFASVNSRDGEQTHPAKTMLMWYFRDAASGPGLYNFAPKFRQRFPTIGTSLAPRGKIIMNAFYQDRSTISGVAGLSVVSSGVERPTVAAFMNSRIFYGGVKSSGFGSTIYFSSIIKSTDTEVLFYQRSDPTSEVSYELLPNDGGTIVIPEAENITALKPVKNFLLVFCSNGIWSISGSEGVGFTATDYTVEKLSDTPILEADSLLVVDNTPIWWNSDGIYAIQLSTGSSNVVSLTKDTIQTFFNSIPNICKEHVVPAYNRLTSEVYWLYSSDEDAPKDLDSLLVFKTTTKAFYKHSITQHSTYRIKAMSVLQNRSSGTTLESVLDNTSVVVTATDTTAVTIPVNQTGLSADAAFPIFLVYNTATSKITFGNFVEDQTEDWLVLGNSVTFDSYLISGYRIRGDAMRKSQIQYIVVYTRYKENSSCKLSGIWDYATSEEANRYTTEQEVCSNKPLMSVNSRKLRIRGSGLTLQLKFRSVGGAPFRLVGWAASEAVNDRV